MRTLLLAATVTLFSMNVSAQAYNTQQEMQEDLRTIINNMKLEQEQMFDLGKIMDERRQQKEKFAQQIKAVNERGAMLSDDMVEEKASLANFEKTIHEQMDAADEKAYANAEAIFTPSQKATFQSEIKPKLEAAKKERFAEKE